MIKASILNSFIRKYYLAESNVSVVWKVNSIAKTLTVSAFTPDKLLRSEVELKNFDAISVDAEFGINDTTKLIRLLGTLESDVEIETQFVDKRITSVIFSDKSTDIQYVTADLSVIPPVGNLKKQLPTFNVEIKVDKVFTDRYVALKNSLPDANAATFMMNKQKKLEIVVGHSSKGLNTTKVKFQPTTMPGKDSLSREFYLNADYLKEVLLANRDSQDTSLFLSDAGLATVVFSSGDFTSTYYLVETIGD